MLVDLHTHSIFSDGSWSVGELVTNAVKRGVKLLALTDHDTFKGVREFKRLGRAAGLTTIAGAEISVDFDDHNLHLLVYEPRRHLAQFHRYLKKQCQNRRTAAKKVIEQMRAAGFSLSAEKIKELAKRENVGKPHLALAFMAGPINRALLLNQYNFNCTSATVSDFIQKFLDQPGQVGYVRRPRTQALAAIKLMHGFAATVVLAHPDISLPKEGRAKILKELIAAGLDGLEVIRPAMPPDQQKIFWRWIKKYRLLPTAGSDIHGDLRGGGEVGREVAPEIYQRLRRRLV